MIYLSLSPHLLAGLIAAATPCCASLIRSACTWPQWGPGSSMRRSSRCAKGPAAATASMPSFRRPSSTDSCTARSACT